MLKASSISDQYQFRTLEMNLNLKRVRDSIMLVTIVLRKYRCFAAIMNNPKRTAK